MKFEIRTNREEEMRLQMTGFCQRRALITALICLLGIFPICFYYHYYVHWTIDLSVFRVLNLPEKQRTVLNMTSIIADGAYTVSSSGRLGNQMGQYATLYALAKLNRRPAYIRPQTYDYLSPFFKISLPILDANVVEMIKWRTYGLHDWMSDEYKNLSGKYVFLAGYPCSWTFYHHLRDEILREFTFNDFIREPANEYLEKLKHSRKNVTYIGVHVRRGDYLITMPNSWKGTVGDIGYLNKAMGYFRKKYQEPVFVVTSNGMKWCKENIKNSTGDVFFAGDGNESSPGRDLCLLVHCNHTIMTVGTFGFWAGYLAGGEVIYLDNFTLPNSRFLKIFHYDAAFLPEWIGIPANLSTLTSL
ncbi:galactoside alpha-(1,2)-fucosyltransferase 2-like [Ambystoma mexicanum]|uniref:galactoside alpha-(1,2)-fucosyltransferase 2-like n=1 Tax=Ambystoma mexicanum TaxID=8296 RepID=UPI0037E84B1C